MKYYSESTGSFYINSSKAPPPSIEVSEEDFITAISRPQGSTLSVVNGSIVIVPESDESKLERVKGIKNTEAETEYIVTCSAPVLTTAGILMKGGESSASTIKGALDRMVSKQKREPSINTVRLFDVYGQVHVVSFETAEIIAEEIADVVEDALFDLVQKKLAIASATTIEELG